MKTRLSRNDIQNAIAVVALSILAGPGAKAACTAHNGESKFVAESKSLQILAIPNREDSSDQADSLDAGAQRNDSSATVLGLWKKIWLVGGELNDVGFAHFNAGGTELINDVGPLTGGNNFCIGGWTQVGRRHYKLVHPFFLFDDSGKNVTGVAIEYSDLRVSRDGNTFRGTWTQDNYDLIGNLVPGNHFDGTIVGTRITPESSFPFPFPY